VPVYPGSSPQGTVSVQNAEGSQNTYTFKSNDPASKVLTYYQDQLKNAGLDVKSVVTSNEGGMLQAQDAGEKRVVMVTVGSSGSATEGSVTVMEKK
jgi:hypothetical protein